MELMKKMSANKGITLIALVITIIVLLILAGVTINLTLGENGIFKVAQTAAKNYTNAQNRELANLEQFSNTINDTIDNISRINGKAELKELASKVNSGYTFEGETIILNGDIDLQDEENWTPIGTKEHPFLGTFDGGGHSISNLTINSENEYQGMFGYNQGTIKNIGIESGNLTVGAWSGGIVGNNNGVIENCYNKANIISNNGTSKGIGGIAGTAGKDSSIIKCFNKGNIDVTCVEFGGVSGIVGQPDGRMRW